MNTPLDETHKYSYNEIYLRHNDPEYHQELDPYRPPNLNPIVYAKCGCRAAPVSNDNNGETDSHAWIRQKQYLSREQGLEFVPLLDNGSGPLCQRCRSPPVNTLAIDHSQEAVSPMDIWIYDQNCMNFTERLHRPICGTGDGDNDFAVLHQQVDPPQHYNRGGEGNDRASMSSPFTYTPSTRASSGCSTPLNMSMSIGYNSRLFSLEVGYMNERTTTPLRMRNSITAFSNEPARTEDGGDGVQSDSFSETSFSGDDSESVDSETDCSDI
jgi:hypothetical protein